jgi:hypothetical protein
MATLKLLFNMAVLLENAGTTAAAFAMVWLHSRYHWMTGPRESITIDRVAAFMLVCSLSGLILGFSSLIILRLTKRRGFADFSGRKLWAWASLLASVVLFLLALLPIRFG